MNLPYGVLVQGCFAEDDLNMVWTNWAMKKNIETERLIEESWSQSEANALTRGQSLFPGKIYRLVGWSRSDRTLRIELGPTDYRELVGTNLRNPGIARRFGTDFLANGVGVCSVVVTTDHKILVQTRSSLVFENPGKYHVCGGQLQADEGASAGRPTPFLAMKKELLEELAITPEAIDEMRCLGLVTDSHTLKPEIIFKTLLRVSGENVAHEPGPEHSRLLILDDSASDLLGFLTAKANRLVPVGLACLVAYGKAKYGTEWYRHFLSEMGARF